MLRKQLNFVTSGGIQTCSVSNRKGQFYLLADHLWCPLRRGVENPYSLATINCPYLWQDIFFLPIYYCHKGRRDLRYLWISKSFSDRSSKYMKLVNEFEDGRSHLQCFSPLHITINFQGIKYSFVQSLPYGDKTEVVQCLLTGSAHAGIVTETEGIR